MNKISTEKAIKFAFTLAEALVAIAIIGVLMALLLRSLNRVNPDKDKILFIKTYHAVEAVIADIINDPSKYDSGYYSEAERNKIAEADRHMDFRDAPLPEATVMVNGTEKKNLTNANAICYFLADQLNSIGEVNCDSNSGISVNGAKVAGSNFRASNGVCFNNFNGINADGSNDPVIDPTCGGTSKGYVIWIYRDGKMTVPETHDNIDNQGKAFDWMNNQSKLNDK